MESPSFRRRRFALRQILGLVFLFVLLAIQGMLANGEIFPADPAAQSAIDWKNGYFYVDGKPTFLTSGEMHYARIPRELWRDRIWRAQQMGFNCMQMYVFWNATEGKEGKWDFSDNLDLDAWLSLLQEMGMYAVVRVGPYSCAEWEHGGFPAWLSIKPGMTLRDSGPFLPLADRHLEQVEKIVAKHQINHGGNVLMVQLENEHPNGWGTNEKDPYLAHLVEQARTNGLEVPLFLSGEHHGGDPSGESPYVPGTSPWYTTEFWTGWIGRYGDMEPGMLNEKIRGTWKIIAFGGAGYDYYMVHGGTNFGYSGNSLQASYDYSAPIGETGQFHNFYFPARRAAYFAQSFSPLLTGSHNDPSFAKSDLPGLRVTTRTNPTGGSIVFVDNFQKHVDAKNLPEVPPDASAYQASSADKDGVLSTRITAADLSLPHQGGLKVSATEPRTLIVHLPWTDNASFESVCTNVMMRQTLGNIDYWVCYGPPGDSGEVTLEYKDGTSPAPVDFTYPTDATVTEIPLDSGDGHRAELLVMNTELTKKTWLVHDKLYVGPSFVLEDGSMEFPPEGGRTTIYAATGKSEVTQAPVTTPELPQLSRWTWRDAATERSPDFNVAGWSQSKGPQAMESYDGFENRYGWYRTTLHCDSAGPVSLHFGGQSGNFVAFLDGQPTSLDHLDAKAGDNALAILAKGGPRPTLYNFVGPIGTGTARGLWGGVSTDNASPVPNVAWKQWADSANSGNAEDISKPDFDDSAWPSLTTGADQKAAVVKGTSWLRGTFTVSADQVDSILQVRNPAGGSLFLNGQRLDATSQDVSQILVPGKNVLLLQVQSKAGDALNLSLSLRHNAPLNQTPWYFRGGLTGLQETPILGRVTNWSDFLSSQPWQSGASASPSLPAFWRCTFTYHQPAGMRETIGLLTTGLKAGHVWLNGHNLGECPQTDPMYMPECWLNDGDNNLVVFDLYGNKPNQVQLSRYEVFAVAKGR